MSRKSRLFLAVCCIAPACHATQWFLLSGEPGSGTADSAELDVSTIGTRQDSRQLMLRISLAEPRRDEAGRTYRSYVSRITVVCSTSSIVHEAQWRYQDANWSGQMQEETFGLPRPMAFLGLVPNPRERLLAAACPR